VTGGQIPPLWVPLAELARWLQDMHGLTEAEIRDVVLDLRRVSLWFQVSFRDGVERVVTDWDDWVVNWETGTVRGNKHPDGPDFPLEVLWDAVADAVTRLRSRQRRERLAVPAPTPPKPKAPVEAPPPPKAIPPTKLLAAWAEYLTQHPDPDTRPNKDAQRAGMAAAFPDHAPPDERAMQRLRADPITPPKWREGGRRPKPNKKSN
jgi:hypothetical protein